MNIISTFINSTKFWAEKFGLKNQVGYLNIGFWRPI